MATDIFSFKLNEIKSKVSVPYNEAGSSVRRETAVSGSRKYSRSQHLSTLSSGVLPQTLTHHLHFLWATDVNGRNAEIRQTSVLPNSNAHLGLLAPPACCPYPQNGRKTSRIVRLMLGEKMVAGPKSSLQTFDCT